MRLKPLRLLVLSGCLFILSGTATSQNFSFNCSRDTLVPGCPANLCITVKGIIPDIYGQSTTYSLNPGSFVSNCFPVYVAPNDPAGSPTTLSVDDTYSSVVNIGFPFPFYGTVYNDLVVSTNGYVSFDISLAGGSSHWQNRGDLPNTLYDRALIMGPYHDLFPGQPTSPTQLIQYQLFGTAPHRRWILSFYKVPLFQCTNLIENTHQIILYESTGIFEVKIFDKEICTTWIGGKAMVGIQDFTRTLGMTAPLRRMTDPAWGSIGMNETWRFAPNSGPSLFKRVELYDITGTTLIATGTTAPVITGCLEASFPNICAPAGAITSYLIKSVYEKFDDPTVEIFGYDTVRVNRANPLTGSAAPTPASCGASDGTITVSGVSGGTPAYEYSLDGITWQSSNVFTGLAAGTYTVYIRDNGAVCSTTLPSIVVTVTGTISETHSTTPAICAGSATGSITISAAGGTGPYTFSLNGAPAVPGTLPFTFNNLLPAGYSIQVYDLGTGCNTGLQAVFVSAAGGITGTSSHTAASCVGVNNGTFTATATSGTGPYTWSLDGAPAVPGASPYTFTNVSPGLHFVIITDLASGCSTAGLFENVAAGPGVTGTTSALSTSCAAISDGSITVNITAGTAPYTYVLDGGAPFTGGSPYTFNGVATGLHNITVTDANGCTNPLPPINVSAGIGVTGNTSSLSTSCPSAANGSITVTITTGAAPYTYVLDAGAPVSGGSPYTFNGVAAGAHNITVTDNNGCNISLPPVTVNPGPVLTGNNVMATTSCSGAADGTVTVTPVGGAGPYTFSLDGGAPQSGSVPFVFTGLAAGPHNVVITDAAGCQSAPIDATITAGPVLTTTASASPALCNGSATGSITVTAPTMGVGPYQYSLDNVIWQASNIFNGLVANTYTVYYQSSNGCSGSTPGIVVSAPASVSASHTTNPVSCNGLSDGTITITANGGVPPYQYSIDGGATWQASNVFTVAANNYPNILIRDANNCTTTQSATVTQPAALAASYIPVNATCNGGSDGTITITATGGNAGYQYSLDGVNFQPSNIFNVIAGSYTVTVRDSKGCITTIPATVGLTNDLTFTPMLDETICEGTSVQLNSVSNGLQYAWTPAGGLSNATIANPVANPTTTTTYTITITRGLCTATDDVIVNVNPAPIPNAGPDGFICYGQTYTLQGSGGSQYTWTPSTYLNDATIANPVSNPARTITYTLSEVTDAIGCKSLTTDVVTVDVTPPIKVTTFPFDTVAYAGDQFQLNATSIANIYTWSPAVGLSNPNIANPVVTVGPIGSDVLYQVTASTIAGCKGEGYVRIKVYTGPDIYMPTGFTPNNDGKNDKFTPFPVGINSITYFRVFNRWGQLVFSSNKLHDGWDGKLGGMEQPNAVYVWMVEGITKDNKVITKRGTVTLIR
ncbi:MAG: T9SS type B sorting domain-containing protein [Chitinophagaceae bacterium]|nr:T9SS type B sorting domain-containing protein [Chitinophagaceae bacterium]